MDVFETLKKNITETGRFAAEKAKLLKDILVVKEQIRSNKKEIRTLTYKIGQTYLELHADDCEEAFTDFIRGIKEAREEMAAKEAVFEDLKEQIKSVDIVDIDDNDNLDEFFDEMEEDIDKSVDDEADEAAEAEEVIEDAAEEAIEDVAEEVTEEAAEKAETAESAESVAEEAIEPEE